VAGDADDEAEAPGEEPDPALLGDLNQLRRAARARRHGYWFPLVLFGLLICASVPFYLPSGPLSGPAARSVSAPGSPLLGGGIAAVVATSPYLWVYWLCALLGGLLLTLAWYRHHGRRSGLETSARGYLITAGVLLALAFLLPALTTLPALHWLAVLWPGDLVLRGAFPLLIIAVGLWALVRAERSVSLALITAAYTAAALLANLYNVENLLFRLGWSPGLGDYSLAGLAGLLLAALVLLATGAGAFVAQHRQRRAA
jgi:hypothetical protein